MAQAAHIDRKSAATARAAEPMRAIPLNLAPLVAPYKKRERVVLRIERLPQQARLSTGQRNNNGSWSLSAEDLDDVAYLVPEGVDGGKGLSIRVISLTGGNTLAVVELPLPPAGAPAEAPAPRAIVNNVDDGDDLQQLRHELAEMKTALAEREAALIDALGAVKQANIDAARALEAAQAEANERVAAAEAQAQAKLSEALSQAKDEWRNAEGQRASTVEEQWQDRTAKLIAEARAEENTTLTAAHESELAALRESLAKLEATLAERDTALRNVTIAEGARAQELAAKTQSFESERAALRETLAKLQTALGERDAALRSAAAGLEEARARWQRETQETLARAEAAWKAGETARLAQVETQWQEKLAQQAQSVSATPAPAPQIDVKEVVAKAEAAWQSAEAARFATAEAQWREKLAAASAAAAGEAKRDDELRAARAEIAKLASERDGAQALAAKAGEAARAEQTRALQEALARAAAEAQAAQARAVQDALAKAEASWKAAQTKAAAAETKSGAGGRALAEAKEALSIARARAKDEIASLKSTLAKREEEIARLKAGGAQPSAPRGYEPPVQTTSSAIRDFINRPIEKNADGQSSFVFQVIVAVVLGVAGVAFYSLFDAFSPPPTRFHDAPLPRAKPEPPPLPAPVERTATLTRDAKLRVDPAAKAAVVAPVAAGAAVVVVEEREAWLLVRAGDKTGWVKRTLISETLPAPLEPAAP